MRKVLKWMAILLGGLLGLALIAVTLVYLLSDSRLTRVYDVEPVAPGLANHAPAPIPLGDHPRQLQDHTLRDPSDSP